MIDKNLIIQARQANLAEYLLSIGIRLKRNGNRYKDEKHDSLVFTKNAYYWNSRQEHGNSIDYLTRHLNMSFEDAVKALTNISLDTEIKTPVNQIANLQVSQDYRRAIAYLTKTRKIDYDIVVSLIESGLLQQEAIKNNIIFPMVDENGVIVGAELQGTLSNVRFKGIQSGSKYGYGFNVKYGSPEFIMLFESAVDLLSFINIVKLKGKELQDCILVSMAGLKTNVVTHFLNVFKGDLRAFSCVDNDKAGLEFEMALNALKIDFKAHRPKSEFKDWNEQLITTKETAGQ